MVLFSNVKLNYYMRINKVAVGTYFYSIGIRRGKMMNFSSKEMHYYKQTVRGKRSDAVALL